MACPSFSKQIEFHSKVGKKGVPQPAKVQNWRNTDAGASKLANPTSPSKNFVK